MIKEISDLLLRSFWFLLPAGFANMAPVFFNKIGFLTRPIDCNKRLRGEPILGAHKTIGGFAGGLISGSLIFLGQKHLYRVPFFQGISILNYSKASFTTGTIMSFGVMIGDLAKSFVKRRIGVPAGKAWLPFDQIDWIVGFLFFTFLIYPIKMELMITTLGVGFLLHVSIKFLGFLLKINESYI